MEKTKQTNRCLHHKTLFERASCNPEVGERGLLWCRLCGAVRIREFNGDKWENKGLGWIYPINRHKPNK